MRYLLTGCTLSILAIIIAFALSDWNLLLQITGGISLVALVICAIFSGAFVDGDRMARNLTSEDREDRKKRHSLTNKIMMIGLPNMIIAIALIATRFI